MNTERKLVTIREVSDLQPIPGADAILGECEIEFEQDTCITDCPDYPVDNESGEFGSCFQALLDQFKTMNEPKKDQKFIGLMAGKFVFTQDYWGEHDMDIEPVMSTITPVTTELHDSSDTVTVQLES